MAYVITYAHSSWLGENDATLSDIGGYDDIKKQLLSFIQHPMNHRQVYQKYYFIPNYGLLLYGPPGCGKTLLIKAIAQECNVHFICVKSCELFCLSVMEATAKIKEIFEKAKTATPCLIFWDDLDVLCGTGIRKAVIRTQLLREMDDLSQRYYPDKLIFFISATNKPEYIDPDFMKSGRINQLIYMPLPDFEGRKAIFQTVLRKFPVAPDVDLEFLAKRTEGLNGADITLLCMQAVKAAVKQSKMKEITESKEGDSLPEITRAHFSAVRFRLCVRSDDVFRKYEMFMQSLGKTIFPMNNLQSPDPVNQPVEDHFDDDLYAD